MVAPLPARYGCAHMYSGGHNVELVLASVHHAFEV